MKTYVLIALLGLAQLTAWSQDTIYVFKKSAPVIKFSTTLVDSISVQKPSTLGADTLLIYKNTGLPSKFAVSDLDSIRFKKPYFPPQLSTVQTLAAQIVSGYSVQIGGTIVNNGGGEILESGVYYSTSPNPTASSSKFNIAGGLGNFRAILSSLQPNTTYYYKAFATNDAGTSVGSELSFTTPIDFPKVKTDSVVGITGTSAVFKGSLLNTGGATISILGFIYDTRAELGSNKQTALSGASSLGSYSVTVTGLLPGNRYYFTSIAANSKGTVQDTARSFTTLSALPTVTTVSVSNITTISAKIQGNLTSKTLGNTIERGVVFGIAPNPTVSDSIFKFVSSTDTFSVNLTRLKHNTTYYVRAFAKNEIGISYGNSLNFKTIQAFLPTVTTLDATNITYNNILAGGIITSDGGSPITDRGISVSGNQNFAQTNVVNYSGGSGTGTFEASTNNSLLSPYSNYYYRAYATNAAGTSYGQTILVKTKAKLAVLRDSAYDRSSTSFAPTLTLLGYVRTYQFGFSIVSNPVENTISAGFVISKTNKSPDFANRDTILFSNTSVMASPDELGHPFAAILYNSKAGTTYYIRSFVTNPAGTSYSKTDSIFTGQSPPEIDILSYSREEDTCYFTIRVATNGAVPGVPGAAGFSANSFFGTGATTGQLGTGLGIFMAKFYADPIQTMIVEVNSVNTLGVGKNYIIFYPVVLGAPVFGTSSGPVNPGVTTYTVSLNIKKIGSSSIGSMGFLYSTNADATGGGTVNIGAALGVSTANLSGLQAGTTYYYKGFATNSSGTSYSEIKSFTTLPLALTAPQVGIVRSTEINLISYISEDGGSPILEEGVVYSTSPNVGLQNIRVIAGTNSIGYNSQVRNLLPGTRYYFRSYAKNSLGTALGPEISVSTTRSVPILGTSTVTQITTNSARVNCLIENNGGHPVTERGVCLTTNQNIPCMYKIPATSTGDGSYFVQLVPNFYLTAGNLYSVRAYAINTLGTANSAFETFYTDSELVSLTTTTVLGTTESSVSLLTRIINNRNFVTEYGFCYGLTSQPTPDTSSAKVVYKGAVNSNGLVGYIGGLDFRFEYTVRPYVINSVGLSYGQHRTVKAVPILPIVSSSKPTTVGSNGMIVRGSVSSKGQGRMVRVGVVYSTKNFLPTLTSSQTNQVITYDTSGSFQIPLGGLNTQNAYYLRVFAENTNGITYGPIYTVITLWPATDLEGNVYDTVKIGNQTWMTQNLVTKKYNDGLNIVLGSSPTFWALGTSNSNPEAVIPGRYAFYNFENANTNPGQYGFYYNYGAVETNKLCPYGWHVPTADEYSALFDFLGGNSVAGGKMKSNPGFPAWTTPNVTSNSSGWNGNTNSYISERNTFDIGFGRAASWWTSTYNTASSRPLVISLTNNSAAVEYDVWIKSAGFNVRCIKD